eukprot:ctg_1666.g386
MVMNKGGHWKSVWAAFNPAMTRMSRDQCFGSAFQAKYFLVLASFTRFQARTCQERFSKLRYISFRNTCRFRVPLLRIFKCRCALENLTRVRETLDVFLLPELFQHAAKKLMSEGDETFLLSLLEEDCVWKNSFGTVKGRSKIADELKALVSFFAKAAIYFSTQQSEDFMWLSPEECRASLILDR